ncbi:ATP-binding protein [Corynebacterium diphtheriae]|nr:ATP-binding protein [Corynebacterium diphtheriae]
MGPLFESLATLSVRVAAESQFGSVRHLRTRRGDHEVDLIASNQDGDLVAIEVKLTADVKNDDVAHLHWLKEQLPDDVVDMVVLTTGNRAYRRSDGVAVVPLALFGA